MDKKLINRLKRQWRRSHPGLFPGDDGMGTSPPLHDLLQAVFPTRKNSGRSEAPPLLFHYRDPTAAGNDLINRLQKIVGNYPCKDIGELSEADHADHAMWRARICADALKTAVERKDLHAIVWCAWKLGIEMRRVDEIKSPIVKKGRAMVDRLKKSAATRSKMKAYRETEKVFKKHLASFGRKPRRGDRAKAVKLTADELHFGDVEKVEKHLERVY